MESVLQRLGLYILEGKKPVPTWDLNAWGKFMESPERIIAQENIGDVFISTVFLGIDHSFKFDQEESPVLFESMVFGGNELNGTITRYHTYSEAKKGHHELVELVRKTLFRVINGKG